MNKVIVIDTSIYCVWLQIPFMETCGKDNDRWDFERVNAKIEEEIAAKSTLVLPLATLIETGNHLSQCSGDRYQLALKFSENLKNSIDNQNPWAAFSEQSSLWNDESMTELANNFPNFAAQELSIGDATIKSVAEYYSSIGFQVEILTGDGGLKAYEPINKPLIPRRRK